MIEMEGHIVILSVSRRTDIPALYMPWFMNRLREGFVLVRNPMNPRNVSRIPLGDDVLDAIVFWTKNPTGLYGHLDEISRIPFMIQFTMTSYGRDIEPNVPSKNDVLIPLFRKIAEKYGSERLVWRYDPILISPKYTVDYHIRYFTKMARLLEGATDQCTISFLDYYRGTEKRLSPMGIRAPEKHEIEEILASVSKSARECGITVRTCSENGDYSAYGVEHASCIDKARLERITGCPLGIVRDKNQRTDCGCFESIDIGAYNSCSNGCAYCYANYSPSVIPKNRAMHDENSPLLFGCIGEEDRISDRVCRSVKSKQLSL